MRTDCLTPFQFLFKKVLFVTNNTVDDLGNTHPRRGKCISHSSLHEKLRISGLKAVFRRKKQGKISCETDLLKLLPTLFFIPGMQKGVTIV